MLVLLLLVWVLFIVYNQEAYIHSSWYPLEKDTLVPPLR